jgi:hypothetical protein
MLCLLYVRDISLGESPISIAVIGCLVFIVFRVESAFKSLLSRCLRSHWCHFLPPFAFTLALASMSCLVWNFWFYC